MKIKVMIKPDNHALYTNFLSYFATLKMVMNYTNEHMGIELTVMFRFQEMGRIIGRITERK